MTKWMRYLPAAALILSSCSRPSAVETIKKCWSSTHVGEDYAIQNATGLVLSPRRILFASIKCPGVRIESTMLTTRTKSQLNALSETEYPSVTFVEGRVLIAPTKIVANRIIEARIDDLSGMRVGDQRKAQALGDLIRQRNFRG